MPRCIVCGACRYALTLSATVDSPAYAALVADPSDGWLYEHVLGYSVWHAAAPRRGVLSGLTSADFVTRFTERFGADAAPPYQAAAQFGVGVALTRAIEQAGSLEADAVAAKMQSLQVPRVFLVFSLLPPSYRPSTSLASSRFISSNPTHAHQLTCSPVPRDCSLPLRNS